ncbi:hypothetical protein [Actinocrispum sp. NPDC049592]|uniref:wHTH domain-containing protein n=1 Tax=Actinocrispum sp. NPDC049592 TaxID=3154835 RepID=UPI00341AEDD1
MADDERTSIHNEISGTTANSFQFGQTGDVYISVTGQPVEPPPVTSANPWCGLAETHIAWDHTEDRGKLRPTVVEIAGKLYDHWQTLAAKLADDPWLDPEFATRMTRELRQRISHLGRPVEFSLLEAALLILTPMVHQVWSAERVVESLDVGPTDLRLLASASHRLGYERFLVGPEQSRLVNRTEFVHLDDRGGDESGKAIGWWLFHQWIKGFPPDRTERSLPAENPMLRSVLTRTIRKITALFRLTPDQLRDRETRHNLDIHARYSAGITGDVQKVDEERVALLLVVAHQLAIDLMRLPMTLVEHFGIPRPVDMKQVKATIRDARWEPSGADLSLVAECHHEAVLESLSSHVDSTMALLAAIRTTNVDLLVNLPAAASADAVKAADAQNFSRPVPRFRLDEARIRELLMGEQLYGDKSLAIRELYQNALDACRWRKARHEASGDRAWTGEIRFWQGMENGRHVLKCKDNGIGMGESDLREVFSRVGVRFPDRREFHDEVAEWAASGVQFIPNSRYGIGVLSYFMLADEIRVTTRRMGRGDDPTGPALEVQIAGPGHLFRIEPYTGDQRVGTEVTLYLRDGSTAPSCVDVLQRLLGIAEFDTHANHDGVTDTWVRSKFEVRPSWGRTEPGIEVSGEVVPGPVTPQGQVVWCASGGGLLVDGVHVGLPRSNRLTDSKIKGALVNLTGPPVPLLTVDRSSVREDITGRISALMIDAVPDLVSARPSFLTYEWLCDLAKETPVAANALTSALADAGAEVTVRGSRLDVRTVGCFPEDLKVVARFDLTGMPHSQAELSDHVLLWRLLAIVGGHAARPAVPQDEVLTALPADELLTDAIRVPAEVRNGKVVQIPPGRIVDMAVRLQAGPAEVADRMKILGFAAVIPGWTDHAGSVTPQDLVLLSGNLDGTAPWLDPGVPVPMGHLIAAHRATRMPVPDIIRRLEEYAFDTRQLAGDHRSFTYQDQFLTSAYCDGKPRWRDSDWRVHRGQSIHAACELRLSVPDVVERLAFLGFQVDPFDSVPDWIAGTKSSGILNIHPLIRQDGTVAPVWVMLVAFSWGIPPSEAARRLTDLGYVSPGTEELPDRIEELDARLLETFGFSLGVVGRVPVGISQLLSAAEHAGCDPATAARRLASLGLSVPPDEVVTRDFDAFDRWLAGELTGLRQADIRFRLARVVVEAAWRFGKSWAESLDRLRGLGYRDPLWTPATVSLLHVLDAAEQAKLSVRETLGILTGLGFEIAPSAVPEQWSDAPNKKLLRLLDLDRAVSVGDVLRTALMYELTIQDVVDRLTRLGLEVPDMAAALPELLARVPFRR